VNRDLRIVFGAVIVNLAAALALNFVSSLAPAWLLFSAMCASAAVTVFGVYRVVQQQRNIAFSAQDDRPGASRVDASDHARAPADRRVIGGVSSPEVSFRCSISDKAGPLVTYIGPDSCELFRLLDAIREFRRPVDAPAQ